ncbi:MAG: DUF4402 domain-containing protein [Alphaproteobacteria bacterium]|nr:DUF4402 domain-containing protein [Alphaproteobacteria bacterium]
MQNRVKISLFAIATVFSSGAFAASGTGHAQMELSTPLTVTNSQDVNFGSIAIDPGAGPQTVTMNNSGIITNCPVSYVCSGTTAGGLIQMTGAPDILVYVSMTGELATLSEGNGNTLTFDPVFTTGTDTASSRLNGGSNYLYIGGSIDFTGNEPAGVYNTTNAGGSGYQVTVNY